MPATAPSLVAPLLDLRFVVLSGKGGVGRTTVAAALARAAADAGKRVLIAQANAAETQLPGTSNGEGALSRLGRMFGRTGAVGRDVVPLAPGIDGVNMSPQTALHEYALMVVRSELVYRALFENRAVRGFLNAIPGLDAYAMLGKAWWHTTETAGGRPRYDLVILDGPASGHLSLMLRIPQAIVDAMPKGPLSGDARAIRDLLSDARRSALVIVTLPEELPVRESAELAASARGRLGVPLGPVVVNAMPSGELDAPATTAVLDRLPPATGDARLDATLRAAATVRAHRHVADEMLARLRQDPGQPLVLLPRLPTAEMGPPQIATLAASMTTTPPGLAEGGGSG
jgi:anion-transporting  ArsA/GET3 family ATPase